MALMVFKNKILSLTGFIFLFSFSSCLERETYPETPAIEFDSFTPDGISAKLRISFTDGDGDVGLNEDQTEAPYNEESYYHYNYYVEYWEWNHDIQQWQIGKNALGDDVVFSYRIPDLTPAGKNKALKGIIEVDMDEYYNSDPSALYSDTIKYRLKLIDRSLKESDWVFSPEIWNGVVQN